MSVPKSFMEFKLSFLFETIFYRRAIDARRGVFSIQPTCILMVVTKKPLFPMKHQKLSHCNLSSCNLCRFCQNSQTNTSFPRFRNFHRNLQNKNTFFYSNRKWCLFWVDDIIVNQNAFVVAKHKVMHRILSFVSLLGIKILKNFKA